MFYTVWELSKNPGESAIKLCSCFVCKSFQNFIIHIYLLWTVSVQQCSF